MIKKIYISFLGYPISLALNIFGRLFAPFMIYGYWNFPSRSFKRFTRYSSTTIFIDKRKINIDDYCWIGPNCIIDGSGGLVIGEGVQIAGLSAIFSHSSHIAIRLCGRDYINLSPENRIGYICKPVVIGDYTFIGVSSVILPGVKIGKGCLIAAGSVLKESVPDFSVVAGNPGKVIGSSLDMDKDYLSQLNVQQKYFDINVVKNFKAKT